MKLNLIIKGGVYSKQCGYTALQFAWAAVEAGYEIAHVFFYQDGVTQGNQLAVPLADEFNAVDEWQRFYEQTGANLVVCVSAAERRGILDVSQQLEFEKTAFNLAGCFQVEGLGAMMDASLSSDRTVTFG